MEYSSNILLILIFGALIWIWLVVIAGFVVLRDTTIESLQKFLQITCALCLPILGAILVLYFAVQHSPELVPKKYIPWPFRNMVFGKAAKQNKNRDENEAAGIDLRASHNREQRFHDSASGHDSD